MMENSYVKAERAAGIREFVPTASWPSLLSQAILTSGLLALAAPTLWTLARWSWSTESGAHGPIVLATGLWLLWHERRLVMPSVPATFVTAGLVLLIAFPLYYIGRVTQILLAEGIALFAIIIAVAALKLGWSTVIRFWFPILYLAFILSPPENWLFVATRPLKSALAAGSIDIMAALGFDIAGTASMILIDGYKLQVAAACSGVNSLIGIIAIGLFYIYLRHGSQARYAAVMVILLVPLAVLTNFLRIIILILVTHAYGDGAAFDFAHDFGGIAIFGLALVLLLALDEVMYPLVRRIGWVR
ncbi:exosortase [Sphingomonas xinjiangensis]|uniref:Exosortase n=1 Tax=Sphingomonas xinjiangensis TaxID=643568 RepID=A0A840YP01_9SPHN|nr:exosortase [Sphingomonas xinjiangensis]MBB5712176.1 exosortase [Sphingomonas xinjiangensis]